MNRNPDRNAIENGAKSRPGQNVVAVDGPAGSGKTTVAVRLANRLGAVYLDTGLLYRAATLLAFRGNLTPSDGNVIASRIRYGSIQIRTASRSDGRLCDVLLDGEDVTNLLRSAEIDHSVSVFAAIPEVRLAFLPIQRTFAGNQRVIMVGRDIATIVFPDAAVKIYLDAGLEERARRRWVELKASSSRVSQAEVEAELQRRDGIDSNREAAPLRVGPGADLVNTDGKTIDQVVEEVASIAERIWSAK